MDEPTKYLFKLIFGIAVALLFIFSLTSEQYTHPALEKNCDQPNDYPVCRAAHEAQELAPPTMAQYAMGALLTVALSAILLYASWCASITTNAQTKPKPVPQKVPEGDPSPTAKPEVKTNG